MSENAFQKGVSGTFIQSDELDNWTIVLILGPASRWIASDKSTRVPISTFRTALKLHGVEAEGEEVECMVANMIYRVSDSSEALANQVSSL